MGEYQCPRGSRCICVLVAVSKPGNRLRFPRPRQMGAKFQQLRQNSNFQKSLRIPETFDGARGEYAAQNCIVLKRLENTQIGGWLLGFGFRFGMFGFGILHPDGKAGRRICRSLEEFGRYIYALHPECHVAKQTLRVPLFAVPRQVATMGTDWVG